MAFNQEDAVLVPRLEAPSLVLTEAHLPSPASPADSVEGTKLKKPPPITPNSFRRFFTPRLSSKRGTKASAARQALRNITASANNHTCVGNGRGGLSPFADTRTSAGGIEVLYSEGSAGKRKALLSPDTSPDRLCGGKRTKVQRLTIVDEMDAGEDVRQEAIGKVKEEEEGEEEENSPVAPIKRSSLATVSARLFQRSLGFPGAFGGPMIQHHCADWRSEVGNFYSRPGDSHLCMSVSMNQLRALPFCTASCNTNSLVAIGDEEGGIRLVETAKNDKYGFKQAHLGFRPHANAILDLAFSYSDSLLATASGDQTARIIDMPTQRTSAVLAGHVSSVKQVRFQPGLVSSSVIATSSRDGTVQIWDLRCKGWDGPVRDFHVGLDEDGLPDMPPRKINWARTVNSIYDAHADRRPGIPQVASGKPTAPLDAAAAKGESPGRRGDVSITALAFLPEGREHLLLTASEANACIKLWDLRTTHTHRRGRAVPLSTTRQPENHDGYRQFGLNSLNISRDGARIYSLCRDNTLYAYSTSHLILGSAPELSSPASRPRRSGAGAGKEGLGPIYGFRHPKLHATSFYVKSALRFARGIHTEMLAVASSDGCAVVFPTDEQYMNKHLYGRRHPSDTPAGNNSGNSPENPRTPRLGLSRSSSSLSSGGTSSFPARLNDTIPIHHHGAALIRGHQTEVTGLSWTSEGELVTVGDDFLARCWREGEESRGVRRGGEEGGRRWGWGWAEVEGGDWERDDDDD
ncbi:hypothetical protein FGG08_005005 [Glutinoglossum americanum]|uniref:Uncharacterized protein n=1 Tax=Glutinoglossum americanum TaxID=1670608 RepID=A0A9P8IAA9_9PEZI|nr:hypothetical protein FGG08_005005 [Glutinoglossum americanum]